jgi:hypothetical protein
MGTVGLSIASTQLGSVMTQGLGLDFLDYISITQEQGLGSVGSLGANDFQGTLGSTVVETGFYVADNMFVTLLVRPAASQGGTSGVPLGVRFEWTAPRGYTLQSYYEDQFSRARSVGFGQFGLQSQQGLGLSIFRDWTY